jgi:ankyrin repeat protein
MISPRSLTILLLGAIVACSSFRFQAAEAQELGDLFIAARNDDPDGIKEALLQLGTNINDVGPGGQTALLFSILSGRSKAAEYLVQAGADVTATEKDGYNVLHASGFQGRDEILSMLLDNPTILGFVNEPHQDGYYAIHRACWGKEERHTNTVRIFVEKGGVDIDVKGKTGKATGKACADVTRNQGTLDLIAELKKKKSEEAEL